MDNVDKMLEINVAQKQYYEFAPTEKFEHGGNIATNLWDRLRENQYKMTDEIELNTKLFDKQKVWLGDLSEKKVLDLGCFVGNELSEYLATNSKYYVACDLSESALKELENKLVAKGITNAHFCAEDILSDKFTEREFDVIYAKAVFHHFEFFEDFLIRIKSLLKKGGIIITSDPINTFLPLKIVRALYRPFQYDKNWEYPFTEKSISLIQKHFEVLDLAGMMGKTKYAFPLYMLSKNYAVKKSKAWVDYDLNQIKINDSSLRSCLRVSFKLQNK